MHLSPIPPATNHEGGFTLIELSIVLVIIGLIVGGVLVGQDLIRAAEVRATVSQFEKYNTAVNTFRVKYNAIPGDITSADAATFGLTVRPGTAGLGDGNGLIEAGGGVATHILSTDAKGSSSMIGETAWFWGDLTTVGLVDGSFTLDQTATTGVVTSSAIAGVLPPAKLGRGNNIAVYAFNGANYFAIAGGINSVTAAGAYTTPAAGLTVVQAYNIDKKMDDGIPESGNIIAALFTTATSTVAGTGPITATQAGTGLAAVTPAIGTTCFDLTSLTYALNVNAGAGVNCALIVKFQ
jgi:prepilin-type N-terminal cleavage/methylation domain-containing protein